MNEDSELLELKNRLSSIIDYNAKIDFIEKYLKNQNSNLNLNSIAQIYEMLGELNLSVGNLKGTYFQKAGATFETLSVLNLGKNVIDRETLNRAYKNYQMAYKIFKKNENYSLMNETEKRLNDLREQLFKDLGPMKKLTITSVLFLFVLSFFLLSSSFTGFVVVPMDEGDTTLTGFVFAITAILGMFIVSRWLLK